MDKVKEGEVSVYPGRVYRLSAYVSQTMFTENSTHYDICNSTASHPPNSVAYGM